MQPVQIALAENLVMLCAMIALCAFAFWTTTR